MTKIGLKTEKKIIFLKYKGLNLIIYNNKSKCYILFWLYSCQNVMFAKERM